MKRKFLSIALCLTLCFTSMMFFTACKEKPEAVSEVVAAQELNEAMKHLNTSTAVKMTGGGLYEGLLVIASEDTTYVKEPLFGTVEAWVVKEGDYFYEYSIVEYALEGDETETQPISV